MKTITIHTLVCLVIALGIVTTARAQHGTVHFGNDESCLIINGQTANPVTLANNVKAALYWAPLASSDFIQIGAVVNVGHPLSGIFIGGTRSAAGETAGGAAGQFQVRAWGGSYPTYEQALGINGVLIGHSAVLTVTTGDPGGDPPTPPTALTAAGLVSFTVTNNTAAEPLVLTCATNKTVSCGEAWIFDAPVTSGGCSNVIVAEFQTTTNGVCPQFITRTWYSMDSCGASNICSQTVTVVDDVPPTLTCATNKTVACGDLWDFDAPVASDNCSDTNVIVTILSTTNYGSCPEIFTRTWLATDAYGNTNLCSQTVTVVDATPPVLTCATDRTVNCGDAWTFDAPSATDNCDLDVAITVLATETNGVCPMLVTRTWLATDDCGNTNVCAQTVTIIEATSFTVSCPTNKTVTCTNAWEFDLPTVSGGCLDTNGVIAELSTFTNSLCPLIITRTWEITNACSGTPVGCAQTIFVECADCPVLALTKTCPPHPVPPGGILAYSGTVTNISEITLTNVIVWNAHPNANTLAFGPATLAPGEGAEFAASYIVPANVCDLFFDTLTATGVTPLGISVTNTLTTGCPVATTITPGDTNGDGIVDQAELNVVLANYWTNSPWLTMTNPATLGGGMFQFGLTNASAWNFTVLVTTNFTDWTNLPGPAYPVYQFHDPEATNAPQRYYRLQWP